MEKLLMDIIIYVGIYHMTMDMFSKWILYFYITHLFVCLLTFIGIRGELHIMVKIELFSDFNKFRQSSCGVQFFSSKIV